MKDMWFIVWDKVAMQHKHALECVDQTIRDLTGVDLPFGGKVVLFAGDFQQTLPIVRRSNLMTQTAATLKASYLWNHVEKFALTLNIRLGGAMAPPVSLSFCLIVSEGRESPSIGYVPYMPLDLVLDLNKSTTYEKLTRSAPPAHQLTILTIDTPVLHQFLPRDTLSPMLPPPPISTLPNPDPNVTEPFDHRKQLDNFVKEFAPHQGYGIIIGHSGRDPHLYCKYECHRGGKPAKRKGQTDATECDPPKKTRSIKIGCPFKMKATFHRERRTWTLHHENTYHNHGPMEMEILDITPSIAPTSLPKNEQPLSLESSHEPKNVPLEPSVQSKLLLINNRILSMTACQQEEIVQSIHQLLDAVCNVPEDKISTTINDPHTEAALQILDEMEHFQDLIQLRSPLHDEDNDISITYHLEEEKSPTRPNRINIDALNITLTNNQPLMNDQPSLNSIDSFIYEDLLQTTSLQPGAQTNCQDLDVTCDIDVNAVAKEHESSSHENATNINQEAHVSTTLPLPTPSINNEPHPLRPVEKSSHVPIPSTRSTIKNNASVSPC
ncbi:uncharacterized protein MELLADRAFT_91133 [Melampsora larici-populina 98AG31]|uniref:ATP-dependent DNA helicase n=1 Tax=Melampsora larici-populina (strain 98AG31 / pathotype 3-4-7) TaxID=747676 RepID=F4R792_MELLP|nr:uncharacterized protein MELLADRAFT_91133 [Melampsora larici-populina 98AG31]EGG11549.1 hypothetical protein MELLADRAFT_91133 [Melampsora larici-populina 98AG31]